MKRSVRNAPSINAIGAVTNDPSSAVLDLLDRKILHALNDDVRASYAQIARRVRSSKDVVKYRIDRLERIGIIQGYVTIFEFGYWGYKTLIAFSHITPAREREILRYLSSHPLVNWLTPCAGTYDLAIAIMAKNPREFDEGLRSILAEIGPAVKEYKVSTSIGSPTFGYTPIFGAQHASDGMTEARRRKSTQGFAKRTPNIDEKDRAIAKILHVNARSSLTAIWQATDIPVDTVKYRIKRMMDAGIIKRFRLVLDLSGLGYARYEVFMQCAGLTDTLINSFLEYARQTRSIEYFGRYTGGWDIEMTVHLRSSAELRQFVLDLKERFGGHIRQLEILTLFTTQNFVYLPPELR